MIEFTPSSILLNTITTPTSGASQIPARALRYPSEAELLAALNAPALEAAMASAGDPGGQENKNFGASMLSFAVVALKHYISLGKSPRSLQHPHVVGRLADSGWTLFVPASGLVMRCNSGLAYGSQTFECLTAYLNDATANLNEGADYPDVPWSRANRLLASSLDFSVPIRPAFWGMHTKTAEVL